MSTVNSKALKHTCKAVEPSSSSGEPRSDKMGGGGVASPNHDDKINVGAGGKLIVPREDIMSTIDIGEEMDLQELQAKKIRKPSRREWVALKRDSELPTRLLLHKPKPDAIDTEYYYVAEQLRGPIYDELKEVRVFVYFSFTSKTHALWIASVTIDNSWYESLQPLFQQPASFFTENAIRVKSVRPESRNQIRYKPLPHAPTWPQKSTEELLGEALGEEHFINSPDHPIYRNLIDGVELG